MPSRLIWLAVRIAAVIAVVVVPFGYAVTGVQTDVLMGAGCGLAVGVGVGLRGGPRSGVWTGVLIGSMVGIVTALLAGTLSLDGLGVLVPPILAVTVGLIDGLSGSSFSGYRDVGRETCIVAALLALGLFPTMQWGTLAPFLLVPWTMLMAGLLSHRREGWRDARPPRLLLVSAVGLHAFMAFMMASETVQQNPGIPGIDLVWPIAEVLTFWLLIVPAAAFFLGRAAITWLQPRLRVYAFLADYLRVMWVPIGGFAVGYLTIIVLFSGFYGMLEHFRPGAFAGGGAGIADWFSFAFFAALGQDFTTIAPISASARMLVGAHLILSAGWALVLFAAVMSSIGPKLDRIARRHADEDDD